MDWFLYDNGLRRERVRCLRGPGLLLFAGKYWYFSYGQESLTGFRTCNIPYLLYSLNDVDEENEFLCHLTSRRYG